MPGQATIGPAYRHDEQLNVSLSAEAKEDVDILKITYKLQNNGATNMGVFNRIESSEIAYIDVEQSTLHIRKMALPVPPDLEMVARPLPNVMQVSPGGVLVDDIVLKLPIAVYNPMKRASVAAAHPGAAISPSHPVQVTKIIVSVGVFRTDQGTRFIPVDPQRPGVFRIWPPGPAVDRQQVLSLQLPLPKAVTVLDY